MAENAETGAAKKNKRGRKKAVEKSAEVENITEAEAVETVEPAKPKKEKTKEKAQTTAEFQESVREQIENARSEIVKELQESIRHEIGEVMARQLQKERRKRCWGNFFRDLLILIWIGLAGYMGYCLYDAEYFDFLPKKCERDNTCQEAAAPQKEAVAPQLVKDTAWYKQNFGYLFENLQLDLDPDSLDAYYLYSDDHQASEIKPSYLLGMAYNKTAPAINGDEIVLPENELKSSFEELFGSLDSYTRSNFRHGCLNFNFNRVDGTYTATNLTCDASKNGRQIVEEIDEIREEGDVLYFFTTATIFDTNERSFYAFDNPFRAVVTDVTVNDFEKHKTQLNRYQYQFKKTSNGHYYFDAVIKLK